MHQKIIYMIDTIILMEIKIQLNLQQSLQRKKWINILVVLKVLKKLKNI